MSKILIGLLLVAVMAVAGCTTKAKARAQAQAAYATGQQQARAQILEAQRINIRVVGAVKKSEIEWADGLTLAQAILAAEYIGATDPREIIVSRQREQIRVNPKDILRGKDVPLEPGDTVEIK